MALTPKQEKFCLEYLKDGNATRAYKTAYDASNMKEATIQNNAYKLLQKNEIATRINELKKLALEPEIDDIKELKKFWRSILNNTLIDDEPKLNDRLKASELLGKATGVFSETRKTEHSGSIHIKPYNDFYEDLN